MERGYITFIAVITVFWAMVLFSWGYVPPSVLLIVLATFLVWKFVGWKAAFPVAFTFFILLLFLFYFDPSYSVSLGTFVASLSAFVPYYERSKQKKLIKQVLASSGIEADNIEFIPRAPTAYDLHHYGIFGDALQVKIWSQKRAYKGLFDTDNGILHMREEFQFPLYSEKTTTLWKEVTRLHDDGTPKQVEFRDSFEVLHGTDYMDLEGFRTERSWRRHYNVVERWNPETSSWESPLNGYK